VPDIVTHLPSFAVQSYYANGLLEPFNDVIEAIGADDYFPGANNVYPRRRRQLLRHRHRQLGRQHAVAAQGPDGAAGIDNAPGNLGRAARAVSAMQTGGLFGAPLPYGRNSMTSLIFIGFIHQAGGQVFSPDLEVAIDNEGTRNALEFYREMREFCPPGRHQLLLGRKPDGLRVRRNGHRHLHRPRAGQRQRPEPGRLPTM
jgi:multiple sugar transport system substrate-binding protein